MNTFLILFIASGISLSGFAQGTLQFAATLNGANEPSPNASTGAGTANFILAGNILSFDLQLQLLGLYSAALYSECITFDGPALPGQSGRPLTFLPYAFPTAIDAPAPYPFDSGSLNGYDTFYLEWTDDGEP